MKPAKLNCSAPSGHSRWRRRLARCVLKIACCAGCWLLPAATLSAAGVSLAWNPSVSTNVAGYYLWAWTNCPDTNCNQATAIQRQWVGNVTNASLEVLIPADYTFGATSVETNSVGEDVGQSFMSNLAHWSMPPGPSYLIVVQTSTNLINWTNSPLFFRLQIQPSP